MKCMCDFDWTAPVEFVNEKGTRWWRDIELTQYAQQPNEQGKKLNHVACWFVETCEGRRTRLLVQRRGLILAQTLDANAMMNEIDILKFYKA